MLLNDQPLVSCIMPTYNRRNFIPHAIRYFFQQDYPNKELIIIDDGVDAIEDLIQEHRAVSYFRLEQKMSLGAKLNLACQYAKGSLIANWDDDDWYAPRRLSYQVKSLLESGSAVCGINHLLYFDLVTKEAYKYIYPSNQRVWLSGSTLCFTKARWEDAPFADIDIGMDGLFVWATPSERIKVLGDHTFSVHMIHEHNVSPKKTRGSWWHPFEADKLRRIVGYDWNLYANGALKSESILKEEIDNRQMVDTTNVGERPLKNVYACLVHENEDCVIDLVRNLHYYDPSSTILLYNGGQTDLFQMGFPYERFGVHIHPNPKPQQHGYLHGFALDCMAYALEQFDFDTFTNVDSDQLAIRPGYSHYLKTSLAESPAAGLFSSNPFRFSKEDTDHHIAKQAFDEYDLWKPLLDQFPDGDDKFVHWTFWPTTIFTYQAVRDLVSLFRKNRQLQKIMKRTKIWATEEVIFPTLVRLLGYDLVANPCSYDFVKYKTPYSIAEVEQALEQDDAYWIHPVQRRYEDQLRKFIRKNAKHYKMANDFSINGQSTENGLFSTLELIEKIEKIDGWLSAKEADLLIAVAQRACLTFPELSAIVEVGSYHGKSTILLGSVVQAFCSSFKVYAIDPHEGIVGAVGEDLQQLSSTLESFKQNIERERLTTFIELIQQYSYQVNWTQAIALLFIDGLHDYPNVARDFWHFSDWLEPGGFVAFHDYAPYYPGVMAFVQELITSESYRKLQQADSLIVLQKCK